MTKAPDSLKALRRDLGQALTLMDDKRDDYERGRDYFDGTRAEVSANKTIRKLIQANAEAVPISLAHIPVEVIGDKIEMASLTATEAAAAEKLTIVNDKNNLEDEADDWITKALYFGDYYAIVDPTAEDGDGFGIAEDLDIVGSSPLNTIVMYDPKDLRTKLYGAKTWKAGKHSRALLYYHDATVKLITKEEGLNAPQAQDFILDIDETGDAESAYIWHEGDRILVSHLAIGSRPYGTPIHKKAWGPQDAITKISATNLSNVDGQGFAARWALADPLAEIDDDIDDDFGTAGPAAGPAADGARGATTGTSRVRSVPGAISILRGIKEVGQFDATGSDDFLKNLDWYVRVMAVACGIALFEFDLKGDQPSGESRRRAEGRANKKAAKIKRQAGAFFEDLGDTILAVLGTSGTVTATFNPSETATDKDGLELVSLKIKAGVPVRQALLEAGYTVEQLDEWYPEGTPHVTPEMLTLVASALQSLGQAKTLGVINEAELADMLPTILTGARGEGPAVDDVDEEIDPLPGVVTDPGTQTAERVKVQADALAVLVRAGADALQAAAAVESGDLSGLTFPNVPVTVRIPEAEASGLEGAGAPAPGAAA